MTQVLIDRELLERAVKADASIGASSIALVDGWKAMAQIRAILASKIQQGVIEDSVQWQATPGLSAANKEVDDLASLVRRLVRQLRKAAPDNDIADKALDYLRRIGKQGNPLRGGQSATQQGESVEVVAWQYAGNPLYTTAERRVMHEWTNNQYPIVELMTVAQHNRILAARVPAGCKVVPVELLERLEHVTRALVPHLQCHVDLRALIASAEGVKDE